MTRSKQIRKRLQNLPNRPGCYLMKDRDGAVLYVGKAINLRARVRSYFHASANHSARTRELVRKIADIDLIIQKTELESLLLEYNLINRYKPKYNVRWKDDKRYPYIKVHWGDPFPKVTVTRRRAKRNDGHRYFGPYTSMWAVHQSLDVLRKVFPYLTCDRVITGADTRTCLYWDIKLCSAPCIGACDEQEYRGMIADLCRFMQGRTEPIIKRLQGEMQAAAGLQRYERAAGLRDQLLAIERIVEKQQVISPKDVDVDVIAFAHEANDACVQVFFIRSGKLIGREYFVLEGTADEDNERILTAFVKQFYHKATFVPQEVLLPGTLTEARIIKEWLRDRRGGRKVALTVPRRGAKRNLVRMATENASEILGAMRAQWQADTLKQEAALAELQDALRLPEPPNRIECFDISNTQGTAATGSMVVFHQGTPEKSHYRRFTIRTVAGPDDYAGMREVLVRRFRRWQADRERDSAAPKPDEAFARLPDLLLVDGGKGQLGIALAMLREFKLSDSVCVAALAKQNEELFVPGQAAPVALPPRSPALFLAQRIRDEAHRFALAHHRQRRRKSSLASRLDSVPGIGPARRKALLRHFGSLKHIRAASLTELLQADGMTRPVAQSVKELL